jgi:CubicO group peptidase (beta-lactamase class C family)
MKFIAVFFAALILIISAVSAEDSKEVSTEGISNVDRYLNRAVENGYSGSVLIALRDKILLTKGYGFADTEQKVPFTAETIFDIGSITKQFTAACILKLEMQGKLSTQDPITKFFDSVPDDKKSITLHHLLTHTAGLIDSLGADEEWISREDYLKVAFDSKLFQPPGKYAYSNVGYSVLAAIVEKVSGTEYEQFLSEQLLKPAGMKETGYVLPRWNQSKMAIGYQSGKRWGTTFDQSNYSKGVTWHLKGNGGMHSTVGDLYLWAKAIQGTAVLSESAKQKYFAPHAPLGEDDFYAYGWRVFKNNRGETVIGHNGGNGSFMDTLIMVPKKDFVVIVSTNRYPKNTDTIATRIDKMLFEKLEELQQTFIKKYEGIYRLSPQVTFRVSFNENDEAVVLLDDPESWRVFNRSDKEDAARVKQMDEKTRRLMTGLLTGDFSGVTAATGMEQKAVQAEFPRFLKEIEEQTGDCKSFDLLGSVQRRNGEYHLTPVRFKCEKSNMMKLIVWHGDNLAGFRDLPEGNTKSFEHMKGNEFFSDANNLPILFDDVKNKPVIRIKTAAGEIIATKR